MTVNSSLEHELKVKRREAAILMSRHSHCHGRIANLEDRIRALLEKVPAAKRFGQGEMRDRIIQALKDADMPEAAEIARWVPIDRKEDG